MKSLILLLLSLFLFSSCSNYIAQMHKEFDRAEGVRPPAERDKFAMYRGNQRMMPKQKPMVNSDSNPYVVPSVKRKYSNPDKNKRYKANDLADNAGDGSLWSGVEGRDNYLFTQNDKKSHGDIILIKVAGKLKNDITAELRRAFPSPIKSQENNKEEDKGKAPASTTAETPTGGDDQNVDASTDKVYDRVSSVVVEEINEDHLLLRGRKNVLYKNRKRVIEIQALVARRDVLDDDTINSNKVIENQVSIVR